MIRIILKLQSKSGKKLYYEVPDGRKRHFNDLVSHKKDIENDVESMESFKGFYLLLTAALLNNSLVESEVLDIYGRMMVNTHKIFNDALEHIGFGLYLGTSVLDHSCAPNSHWHFQGKEMIIRTIDEVKDFSEIRKSYLERTHFQHFQAQRTTNEYPLFSL